MEQPANKLTPPIPTSNPTVNTLLGGMDPAVASSFAQKYNDYYANPGSDMNTGIYPGYPTVGAPQEKPAFSDLIRAQFELNTIMGPFLAPSGDYSQYLPASITASNTPDFNAIDYLLAPKNYQVISKDPAGSHIIARGINGAYRGMNSGQFLEAAAYDAAKFKFQQQLSQASFGQNLAAGLLAASPEIAATAFIPLPFGEGGVARIAMGAGKAVKAGEVIAPVVETGKGLVGGSLGAVSKGLFDLVKPAAGAAAQGAAQMGMYGAAREAVYQGLNSDRSGYETANRIMSDMVTGGILGIAAKAVGTAGRFLKPEEVAKIKAESGPQNFTGPDFPPPEGEMLTEPQGPAPSAPQIGEPSGPMPPRIISIRPNDGPKSFKSFPENFSREEANALAGRKLTDVEWESKTYMDLPKGDTLISGRKFAPEVQGPVSGPDIDPAKAVWTMLVEPRENVSRVPGSGTPAEKATVIEFAPEGETVAPAKGAKEIPVTSEAEQLAKDLHEQFKVQEEGKAPVKPTSNEFLRNERSKLIDILIPLIDRTEAVSHMPASEAGGFSTIFDALTKQFRKIIENREINPDEAIGRLERSAKRLANAAKQERPVESIKTLVADIKNEIEALRSGYDERVDAHAKGKSAELLKTEETLLNSFLAQENTRLASNFTHIRDQANVLKENYPDATIADRILTNIERIGDGGTIAANLDRLKRSVEIEHSLIDEIEERTGEMPEETRNMFKAEKALFADYEAEVFAYNRGFEDRLADLNKKINDIRDLPTNGPDQPQVPQITRTGDRTPLSNQNPPEGWQNIDSGLHPILNVIAPKGRFLVEGDKITVQVPEFNKDGSFLQWGERQTYNYGEMPALQGEVQLGEAAKDIAKKSAPEKVTVEIVPSSPRQEITGPDAAPVNQEIITNLSTKAIEVIKSPPIPWTPPVKGIVGGGEKPPIDIFIQRGESGGPEPRKNGVTKEELVQEVIPAMQKANFATELRSGFVLGAIFSESFRNFLLSKLGLISPAIMFQTYTKDKTLKENTSLHVAMDFPFWSKVLEQLPDSPEKQELMNALQVIKARKNGDVTDLGSFNNGVIRLLASNITKDAQYHDNNAKLIALLGIPREAKNIAASLLRAMQSLNGKAIDVGMAYHDIRTEPALAAISTALKSIQGEIYPDKSLGYNVRYLYSKVDSQLPGQHKGLWHDIYSKFFAPLGAINERVLDGINDRGAGESGNLILDHAIAALSSVLDKKPIDHSSVVKHVNEALVSDFGGIISGQERPQYSSLDNHRDMASYAIKDFAQKNVNNSYENLPFLRNLIVLNQTNRAMAVQKAMESAYGVNK